MAAEDATPPARKKLSAVSLLPDGSELKGVMLPRYDENHRLIGVLKAAAITLVNEEMIAGDQVAIRFSNPDGSPRGHINLTKAVFNQVRGILEANEPVTLQSDRLRATGTGLFYAFEQGEGFLAGPATTWIQAPIETTMNSSPSPLRATALVGISLITQSLAVAPLPAVKTDAAPVSAIHSDATRVARMNLRADLDASSAATAKAKAFLEQAELVSTAPPGNDPEPAAAKPLDINPGPNDTVIRCDGGMYFDADQGVFVYLKNVRVTDPRFTLTGANELKVFLGKKPEDPAKAPDKKDQADQGLGGKFGDVERIIATGAIAIEQKAANGKDAIKASGAIFAYNIKTDQVTITGGYPWLLQQGICLRAKQPDQTIRLSPKAGSAVADPGDWETIFNLEQLQKKPQ